MISYNFNTDTLAGLVNQSYNLQISKTVLVILIQPEYSIQVARGCMSDLQSCHRYVDESLGTTIRPRLAANQPSYDGLLEHVLDSLRY